jgi:hypothetical protein
MPTTEVISFTYNNEFPDLIAKAKRLALQNAAYDGLKPAAVLRIALSEWLPDELERERNHATNHNEGGRDSPKLPYTPLPKADMNRTRKSVAISYDPLVEDQPNLKAIAYELQKMEGSVYHKKPLAHIYRVACAAWLEEKGM